MEENLQKLNITTFQQIQNQENFIASFSPEMLKIQQQIKCINILVVYYLSLNFLKRIWIIESRY